MIKIFKKVFVFLIFSTLFLANGFKIQEQSLNGTALNSAYVAGARGADASYYNPANLGFSNDWSEREDESELELANSLIQIPGFNFDVTTSNQGLTSSTKIAYTNVLTDNVLLNLAKELGIPIPDMPTERVIEHSKPDPQIVKGSTGTTNFILPKFFYKSRKKNGFTFGASFVAPSGLAMQWKGKGGEFLQDVFIMMIEFSPSISYTINDRFSIGIGPRILYARGSFNNVVYVPMQTADGKNSSITLTGEELDQIGIDTLVNNGLMDSSQAQMLKDLFDKSTPLGWLGAHFLGLNVNAIKDVISTSTTTMYGTTKVYQKSDGEDFSAGYRLAASLRVFDNGMFSIVYNSQVPFNMKGNLEATSYIGGAMGNVLTKTTLQIAVNMPEILTIAYAHEFFSHHLRVEGVYERTFWAKGPNFRVTPDFENASYTGLSGLVQKFSSDKLKSMVGLANFSSVSNMGSGWKDTNTYRLGVTYMSKNYRIMGAIAYDEAPSPQDAIGIPDSNGYMFSLGIKRRFKDFSLGIAYSLTFKDNRQSVYSQASNLGQLRILTTSLEYYW